MCALHEDTTHHIGYVMPLDITRHQLSSRWKCHDIYASIGWLRKSLGWESNVGSTDTTRERATRSSWGCTVSTGLTTRSWVHADQTSQFTPLPNPLRPRISLLAVSCAPPSPVWSRASLVRKGALAGGGVAFQLFLRQKLDQTLIATFELNNREERSSNYINLLSKTKIQFEAIPEFTHIKHLPNQRKVCDAQLHW